MTETIEFMGEMVDVCLSCQYVVAFCKCENDE